MMFRNLILCAVLGVTGISAHAATTFVNVPNSVGSAFGETDTILGGNVFAGLNGTSTNAVNLESLDPGLQWGNFKLTIDTTSDTPRPTATASFGSLLGTLISSVDDDLSNSNLLQGWTYTFSFAGTLDAGNYNLTLGNLGNSFAQSGGSVLTLTATAVPEPESYAMMLAGLGALCFMARRRTNQ